MSGVAHAPSHLDRPGSRRGPFVVALALGIGLALAPAAFQMFTRAPLGGQMIEDFAPFMVDEELAAFGAHLDTIDAAHAELTATPVATSEHPATSRFLEQWPGIRASMGGMLADIRSNVDNYDAVAALPPFALFPWFFVVPGLAAAGFAVVGLRRVGRAPTHAPARALAVLGIGLVAAPFAFQMFTRAPMGGDMIAAFEPLMTEDRVADMQASFLTIGGAEGELRNRVLPQLASTELPATEALVTDWPRIGNDMAPMIGAMSDNLDNFAAVAALPPFPLFPWFFVVPGLLLAGAAATNGLGVRARTAPETSPPTAAREAQP